MKLIVRLTVAATICVALAAACGGAGTSPTSSPADIQTEAAANFDKYLS